MDSEIDGEASSMSSTAVSPLGSHAVALVQRLSTPVARAVCRRLCTPLEAAPFQRDVRSSTQKPGGRAATKRI